MNSITYWLIQAFCKAKATPELLID